MPRLRTPGWRGVVETGVFFWAAMGVGLVPSGFTVFEGVVVEVEVFWTAGLVAGGRVEVFVFGVLTAGVVVLTVDVGRVFLVPRGVRVFDGMVALFFTGVAFDALVVVTGVFFTGVFPVVVEDLFTTGAVVVLVAVVRAGVVFAVDSNGFVAMVFAGVVRVSFAGALRTGVAALVEEVVTEVFFAATGVALLVVFVFAGVTADFFAVCWAPWATFDIFPTLA